MCDWGGGPGAARGWGGAAGRVGFAGRLRAGLSARRPSCRPSIILNPAVWGPRVARKAFERSTFQLLRRRADHKKRWSAPRELHALRLAKSIPAIAKQPIHDSPEGSGVGVASTVTLPSTVVNGMKRSEERRVG